MSSQQPQQGYKFFPPFVSRFFNRLAKPIKVPGGVLLAIGVYRFVPDISEETEWWWDRAREATGAIRWVAAMIASPYFSLSLIVGGLLWLIFVDEPKTPMRSSVVAIAGWVSVAVIMVAIIVATTYGYAISTLGPTSISDSQQKTFADAATRTGRPFVVMISSDMGCQNCEGVAQRLRDVIAGAPGWNASANGFFMGLNFATSSGVGIMVGYPANPNTATRSLEKALDAAGIHYDEVAKNPPPQDDWTVTINVTHPTRPQ